MTDKQVKETASAANSGTCACACSEGDKIRFPCGSTFTIFSMLENTPMRGKLFQMTDDLTGELFTEPIEYLSHVEFIPNAPHEPRRDSGVALDGVVGSLDGDA